VGLAQDGILMFSVVIATVHSQLASVIDHWTWMHHASCWGSIGRQLLVGPLIDSSSGGMWGGGGDCATLHE
jgi:hypothetical protein